MEGYSQKLEMAKIEVRNKNENLVQQAEIETPTECGLIYECVTIGQTKFYKINKK